ncbi:hypothetical protein LINPERPRIM_LOCUS35169 [Linum perenne]
MVAAGYNHNMVQRLLDQPASERGSSVQQCSGEDGFESKDIAGLLPDTFDLDVGVDFSAFESQFEDLVDSYEAEAEKRTTPQTLPSYSNGHARANAMGAVKPSCMS